MYYRVARFQQLFLYLAIFLWIMAGCVLKGFPQNACSYVLDLLFSLESTESTQAHEVCNLLGNFFAVDDQVNAHACRAGCIELHGLHFSLLFGRQDDVIALQSLCDMAYRTKEGPCIHELMVNGEPCKVPENKNMFNTLSTFARERTSSAGILKLQPEKTVNLN